MTLASLIGIAPLLCLCAAAATAAGHADVSYRTPERFTDAGFGSVENSRTQRVLSAHFEQLAQRLPDGQRLQVEVLDVDLAGDLRPIGHDRVRVIGLGADAPRLELKFSLLQGDQVLVSGEDRLIDLGYLFSTRMRLDQDALPYERRLLEAWFRDRFATHTAALR